MTDEPTDSDILRTLTARGKTHGDFRDNGWIACQLRETFRRMPNWPNMAPSMQLALDEMALKIARMGSSGADPFYDEPWRDIAGYATVILNMLSHPAPASTRE